MAALLPRRAASRAERMVDVLLLGLISTAVPLSLLLPRPFEDRLACLAEEVEGRPAPPPGPPLGLLAAARARELERTIRSVLAPPFLVLDVGAGGGGLASALALRPDFSARAVDVSPDWHLHSELDGNRFPRASLDRIPFEDEMFDVVILNNVLEHSLDVQGALAEAGRVLRPGGLLLCETRTRSLASFLALGGSHDWRLLIQPEELQQAVEDLKFYNFSYKAWRPSPLALLELLLLGGGSRGAWSAAGPFPFMISYFGQARRARLSFDQFEAGEPVGALGADALAEEAVDQCRVLGRGAEEGTWDLECCGGAEGRPKNVPAEYIHKWPLGQIGAPLRVLHEGAWRDGRAAAWGSRACAYAVELLDDGQLLSDVWHERLQGPAEWRGGDVAEMMVVGSNTTESLNSSKWIRCTVLGASDWRGTYTVRVPTPRLPRPYKDIPRVAAKHLRLPGGTPQQGGQDQNRSAEG